VVSTKIFWGGGGPNDRGLSHKHIIEGTHAALERLQMDYVDLVFCHRPDIDTPMEETVRAMSQLISDGKAFYWGTSEWSAEQIRDAYGIARQERLIPPTMEQPEYNMFHRDRVEKEYASLYRDIGLGTTIWSPLASGLLTGKYNDGIPDDSRLALKSYKWLRERLQNEGWGERIEKVVKLAPIAVDLGCTMAQLALAWCLKNPNVSTVILGASNLAQLEQNLESGDKVALLTDEVIERVETILANRPELPTQFGTTAAGRGIFAE
jgi:voltage-dependent potassium channel beta subunit